MEPFYPTIPRSKTELALGESGSLVDSVDNAMKSAFQVSTVQKAHSVVRDQYEADND
jgi:hypothetical protein